MKNYSVGIIGLGDFGRFVASLVPDTNPVYGFSHHAVRKIENVHNTSLAKTVEADILVLAIPLQAYREVLEAIKPRLAPSTLIVDVCSVKVIPEQLLAKHLPAHQNFLLTHPLFGPQSAKNGTKGHKLVVTKEAGEKARQVIEYCKEVLGLQISRMDAHEHDKDMAKVHALTFFVARGLSGMEAYQNDFNTPSYQMILDLISFDKTHSQALFETIQLGNPYAKETRQQLLKSLNETDKPFEVTQNCADA